MAWHMNQYLVSGFLAQWSLVGRDEKKIPLRKRWHCAVYRHIKRLHLACHEMEPSPGGMSGPPPGQRNISCAAGFILNKSWPGWSYSVSPNTSISWEANPVPVIVLSRKPSFYVELKKDPSHRFSFIVPVCYFFNFIVSGRAPFYFTQVVPEIFHKFFRQPRRRLE